MLESCWVSRVTSDGNANLFKLHNCNAFENIISTVAFNFSFFTVRESNFSNNFDFIISKIVICFYICETVNSGNDISSIFAKTVKDNTERLCSNFVSTLCNTDSTFCSSETFMTCEEAETICFFFKKHGCKVTVTETYFSVFSNRTRDTESLETDTESFSSVSSAFLSGFDCYCSTECISPYSIFKCNRLYTSNDSFYVYTVSKAVVFCFFKRIETVFFNNDIDFINTSFITFK